MRVVLIMESKQKFVLARIVLAGVILVALNFVEASGLLKLALYLVPYLIVGYDVLLEAWKGIREREIFDECFLMAVATIGAFALAIYTDGDYNEAIAVMLLYQIGELFQDYAVDKSRRNITELMDIRPDYAFIEHEGQVVRVKPEEIDPGTIIIIRPGEKVPIDGVIVNGHSSIDTRALTGESLPRSVNVDDEILSGTNE